MSVPVDMADLPNEIVERGAGFLLTSVMDSRPHVAHHHFEVAAADGEVQLRVKPGNTSRQNCAKRPSVSVLWPATVDFSYSLIVDGEARIEGEHVIISATNAILHRPAPLPQ